MTPVSGPKSGGIKLTLSGENFSSSATVTIGSTEAIDVTVLSGSRLTATLPPWSGSWSLVPVVVRNPDASQVSRGDLFAYYGTELDFPEAQYDLGTALRHLRAGDFNGDGRDDLLALRSNAGQVLFFDDMGRLSAGRGPRFPRQMPM